MRIVFCSLLLLFFYGSRAQSAAATDSVKATIDQLFVAIRNADSTLLNQCFAPGAQLQTVTKNQDAQVIVREEPISEFSASVAKLAKDAGDERIVYDMIKIDQDLAVVWTPYQFYYKGAFNHCGVNSFQLVRINNEWKIQYIIDTRRKEDCIEAPKQ
ncbi:nuclear transport factor 2 family protein [Deminuibacter soli]|uniref:Nuclear transport factor 2 family protein n=1 Tax=Deminuibacter soli TaxID=2291815 RepID=A0A3E1NJQ7_9BACT|nr:nuclear transport factor 2 family protein [Deminuibacter soli]RFM28111.1 hypothetical protein DXN05_11315 [Deminuibacter soli]